jgi:hypothetical protein
MSWMQKILKRKWKAPGSAKWRKSKMTSCRKIERVIWKSKNWNDAIVEIYVRIIF